MAKKLGRNAKLYYSSTAATGAALSALSGVVANITTDETAGQADEIDVTTRSSSGWKEKEQGLKDASINFEFIEALGADTNANFFASAFANALPFTACAMNGPNGTSGSRGVRGDFVVTQFNEQRNHDDAVRVRGTLSLQTFLAVEKVT